MSLIIKYFIRMLLVLVMLYLIAFAIIYIQQDRIIFQRQALSPDYHFTHDATELTIPSTDSVRLNALLFHSKDSTSKGLILYFHGNRHSLERWGRFAPSLTALGYDVLMIDYRGYGKSNGIPSEKGLYKDAEATLAWARQHYPSAPLIYYGRSLGTGVATYLATKQMPLKLILETPFDELKNVVPFYLGALLYIIPLRHTFQNYVRIPKITCPILIMHGTADQIVPLSSALALKPLLKASDRLLIVEGGRHYNLNQFDEVRQAVEDFLK
jgi:uncharacterized protein